MCITLSAIRQVVLKTSIQVLSYVLIHAGLLIEHLKQVCRMDLPLCDIMLTVSPTAPIVRECLISTVVLGLRILILTLI